MSWILGVLQHTFDLCRCHLNPHNSNRNTRIKLHRLLHQHLLRVINILPAKIQKLPVNPFIIRYIEVHKYLRTCYPTYFRVAILLQSFPCLNFYSFLPMYASKVSVYRNPQQKYKNLNFGPS